VALRKYLSSDSILRKEIEAKIGPLPDQGATDVEEQLDEADEADDSDVPSSLVIKEVLGIDIPSADGCGRYCITNGDVASNEHGTHLHAMGGAEDVWENNEDDSDGEDSAGGL